MKHWLRTTSAALLLLPLSASLAAAADVEGASDHPLLGRFTGAEITAYEMSDYDAAVLPAGPIEDEDNPHAVLELEGRVTRIAYRIPATKSSLEIARNYEAALAAGGFEVDFSCAGNECGDDFAGYIALSGDVFPEAFGDAAFNDRSRARLAKRAGDDGTAHVFLYIMEDRANGRSLVNQLVVEEVPMATGQVAANGSGTDPVAAAGAGSGGPNPSPAPTTAGSGRPVLAVAELVNEAPGSWWWSDGVGYELSGMLANELAAIDAFDVVERSHLAYVLDEQDWGASGRVRPETAAKIGELTGAQYLVLGTITSYKEDTRSVGGDVVSKGIKILGKRVGTQVGSKVSEAYVAVDVRVVDATTGKLAHVRTIEGHTTKRGVKLRANRGTLGGALAAHDDTPAGEAIRAALIEITDYLECAMVRQGSCLAEYEAKEQRRRERTRGKLRF